MNKVWTPWKPQLLFALRTIILIKILIIAEPAWGQSRLAAIRNEVRQPKTEEPKEERKRPESSDRDHDDHQERHHDHDHDHDHDRHRRQRRNHSNDFDFFTCTTPTQFVHTREIHVIQPPLESYPPIGSPFPQTPEPIYHSVVEGNGEAWDTDPIIDDVFQSSFENWGTRVTGWYGGGVEEISQGNLGILFQSPGSFGLDGNIRTVRERGFSDHLWLGDLNLVYEPICRENFRLRIGAGFNWLADSWGGDAGFNLTSGFDTRISDRLILGGEIDLGNLGSSDYLHAQLSLGYQIDNAELVVGYDHTNIGAVDLNSPFAGIRFRF